MRILRSLLSILLLGLPVSALPAPVVGDAAPDFELMGSDGKTYSLAQFKGVKPVVIAFFPKAFTGG
ncbi:MAG: redoxin domain-containing protein [Proteobacteria bacterium]|nr:redoxin domain-containing protein [Pseudomonadota bacterium]